MRYGTCVVLSHAMCGKTGVLQVFSGWPWPGCLAEGSELVSFFKSITSYLSILEPITYVETENERRGNPKIRAALKCVLNQMGNQSHPASSPVLTYPVAVEAFERLK